MSEAPWSLCFTARAKRDLRRLDPPIRTRILVALEHLTKDHRSGKLSRLTGRPESKLRVGEWRIILELDHAARTVVVHQVLPRGRAYSR